MIPILFPLWLLLSIALFLSLFRVMRFPWLHRGEELFFSSACGLAWMSIAVMVLGLLGLAKPPGLYAAAAATGIASVPLLLAARRVDAPARTPAPREYALCTVCLLLIPLIWLPPFFYDTLHYHYGLPSIFLRAGSTRPLPWFVESHFPLGVEMLSMVGMTDASYLGANLANFVFLVLCCLGILCLADRLGSRRAGLIALPVFCLSSAAIHTLFLQKNDLGVTLFFFAFAYALLLYRESGRDRRFLLLAAALCGASLGAKYTMLAFAGVAFAIGFLRAPRPRPDGVSPIIRDALLFLLAALIVYSPWPLRNLLFTGNPVYPLLNGIFQSPGWSAEQMRLLAGDTHRFVDQFNSWKDPARLLLSITFFPDTDMSGLGASIGASFIGAVLFAVFRRKPAPGWAFLRNTALGFTAVWFFTSWFSRFLLPAAPLMSLLTGFLLSCWAEKTGRWGGAISAVLAAALVSTQIASAVAPAEYTQLGNAWKASFRLVHHPEYAGPLASRFVASYPAARFVNERFPESARILFVGETLPFYFRRDIVAPSAFDEHPLQRIVRPDRPEADIARDLAAQGFTHILLNGPEWERIGRSYYKNIWRKEDRMAVDRFLAGLPVAYRDRAVSIYTIKGDERP